MALALSTPAFWWLGWVTLLPLFFAIRFLDPGWSGCAGAFWGLCLFVFAQKTGAADGLADAVVKGGLLTFVPAAYAAVGSAITRRKGFHPLMLALGWVGVELALQPLGIRNGLLAHTQGEGMLVNVVGHLGGYVLVAFVVALVNASLLSIISEVSSYLTLRRVVDASCTLRSGLVWPGELATQIRFCHTLQPRAPPPGRV